MVFYFDETPVGEINSDAVFVFNDFLRKDKPRRGNARATVTVNHTLDWLRRVFNYAKEQRWIKESQFPKRAALTSHRPPLAARRLVRVEEEKRLLAACTGKFAHLREVLIYLIDTGAYDQDRKKLLWANVDLKRKLVKGRHGSSAKMTPRLYEAMRSLWERSDHAPAGPVWTGPRLKTDFQKVCAVAGIDGLRLNDLRHTAAWRMSQAGMRIEQIAATMGILDLNYVRQYLDVNPETAQQEADCPAFKAFHCQTARRSGER
jgi:integrase